VSQFPSLKARQLLKILQAEPLNYRVVRQSGSHRTLEAAGRPRLTFAFHNRATIAPGLVRQILVRRAGLAEDDALKLL
jgi:predicted RNA binding protein YcfA (HicA-like mRNA interferase family)